jgi:hypothetical protein
MSDHLRRPLNVTPRVLSETGGLVEYLASDATLDSYDEVILASGWRFNLFQKNSPFVDSHEYWAIDKLLGRVVDARIENKALIETVEWAKDIEENALARLGWKMTIGGFLKAVSVGFRVVNCVSPNMEGWNDAVREAGLNNDDARRCRRIFTAQEQLELSVCILGANPNALMRAYDAKCIGTSDLSACGIHDDDLQFMQAAQRAFATTGNDLDEMTKLLIQREMSRITHRTKALNSTTPGMGRSPGKPGGGDQSKRLARERAEFIRRLEALD